MKILVTEEQFKRLISEELGISMDVKDEAEKLFKVIVDDVAKHMPDFNKERFFSTYTGSFTYDFLGIELSCGYNAINYYEKFYAESYKADSLGSSYYVGRNLFLFNITVPCISGRVVKSDVMDTIQHELEHIYQQSLMKKRFGDTEAYYRIRTNMESQDPFKSRVARLAYGCMEGEQEGHVNGMYAYIIAATFEFDMVLFRSTSCYKLYRDMCETFEELSDDERFEDEIRQYGLTKNKIKKSLKTFARRIARTAAKAKRDKMAMQCFRI